MSGKREDTFAKRVDASATKPRFRAWSRTCRWEERKESGARVRAKTVEELDASSSSARNQQKSSVDQMVNMSSTVLIIPPAHRGGGDRGGGGGQGGVWDGERARLRRGTCPAAGRPTDGPAPGTCAISIYSIAFVVYLVESCLRTPAQVVCMRGNPNFAVPQRQICRPRRAKKTTTFFA